MSKKIMVALPAYGGNWKAKFGMSMLDCLQVFKQHETQFMGISQEALISRGRNNFAHEFLKTDCTHLHFLDVDLVFSAWQLELLYSHDKDIVCGLYAKKQPTTCWVMNQIPAERPDMQTGLLKVLYAGTGCMLIARNVFIKMMEKFPDLEFTADFDAGGEKQFGFFNDGIYVSPDGRRRFLSEDWYFCQRWIDCGGDIYADARIGMSHCGEVQYPLDRNVKKEQDLEHGNPLRENDGKVPEW